MMTARKVGVIVCAVGWAWFLACAFSVLSIPGVPGTCGTALFVTLNSSTSGASASENAQCHAEAHDRLAMGALPGAALVIAGVIVAADRQD